MARISVEDCLERVDNRFSLVHLAAKRVRQLKKGNEPYVVCKNREIVTSLREIASGDITRETLQEIEKSRKRSAETRPTELSDEVTASQEPEADEAQSDGTPEPAVIQEIVEDSAPVTPSASEEEAIDDDD